MDEKKSPHNKKIEDLTKIPSIGKLTARTLLDSGFSSISNLKNASEEDLNSLEGLGKNLAKDILKDLEDEALKTDEKKEKESLEIRCPVCERIIKSDAKECQECEEDINITSEIIIPEKGMIENPRERLAEVEERIWDNGDDPEIWFIRASILESMNANRKALESYDKVIELDPLFDNVWNAKAHVSLKIGEVEEAAKAYKLAYDVMDLPGGIVNEIESKDLSSEEKIEEIKKIDEEEKEIEKQISRARDLLEKLDRDAREIKELTMILDEATEEKIEGNKTKALDKADEVIKKSEAIEKTENYLSEFEEKLNEVKNEDLKDRFEKDIVEIKGMMKDFNYLKAKRISRNLEDCLKFQLDNKEKIEEQKKEIENRMNEIEKISEKISKDVASLLGLNEDIAKAREKLSEGKIRESQDLINGYLEEKTSLVDISEKLDKIETMMMGLEDISEDNQFFENIQEKINESKDKLRNHDLGKSEEILETIHDDLEDNISESIKTLEEEIQEGFEEIDDLIQLGFEKDLQLKDIEEEFEDLKEEYESKEEMDEDLLEKVSQLQSKIENIISIDQYISEIDNLLEENEDILETEMIENYKEKLQDINSKKDEQDELKELVNECDELKSDLRENISEMKERIKLKERSEKLIKEGRKSLASLRDTNFDLNKLKNLLKKTTKARKDGDLEKSIQNGEKMKKVAENISKISDIYEKLEEKIEIIDEKELGDKERLLYELNQRKRLAENEKYSFALKQIRDLEDNIKSALENEQQIYSDDEKVVDFSASEIKQKVRDLKDFKSLVERVGFKDIELEKEYLKKAVINIKDVEYDEAAKALMRGKKRLIEEIDPLIEEKLNDLMDRSKKINDHVHKKVKTISKKVVAKWKRQDHLGAIKDIEFINEFLDEMKEKEDKVEIKRLVLEGSLEDLEDLDLNIVEVKEDLENIKEKKDYSTNELEDIEKEFYQLLKNKLNEEMDKLEKNLENVQEEKISALIDHLLDSKSALENKELEKLTWNIKEYYKILQ